MPEIGRRVEAYNTDQPFLRAIGEAIRRTQLPPGEEPRLQFRGDGSYDVHIDGARDSSDTIGTKVELHWEARTFRDAAQDAFAMNANDLYRDRCEPLKLNNVLMVEVDGDDPEDVEAVEEIVTGLSDLCVERRVQMGTEGHETAFLDTISGFELAVFMTGAEIERGAENRFRPGDVLIGIPSSGIHSNGLSDARRLFRGHRIAELRTPTRIYDEVPALLKAGVEVHGLGHVTGGGLSKLRTEGVDLRFARTHLNGAADIFYELYERWLDEAGGRFSSGTESQWVDDRMHRKFNSGIGFVLGVPEESVGPILKAVPDAAVAGTVEAGDGLVVIERSEYTGRRLVLGPQRD